MYRVPVTMGLLAAALLNGCATQPMGPTAHVMPSPGKPFEVFAQDQATCKQFAAGEVDGGATMSNLKEFGTAAVSTVLGAGLGAAVRGGRGAEVGSSVGAIGGSAMAAHGSSRDQAGLQGRYDLAYTQCMYARGNQIGGNQIAGYQPGGAAKAGPNGQSGVAPGQPYPTAAYSPPGPQSIH
jgi:hypothetical protein